MRAKIFSSLDCFCSIAIAFFNLQHALLTLEAVGVQARGELGDARPIEITGDEKASLRELPVELSVEGFWTNIAWWRIGAVAMCCCLFAERFPRGVAAQLPESPADCP